LVVEGLLETGNWGRRTYWAKGKRHRERNFFGLKRTKEKKVCRTKGQTMTSTQRRDVVNCRIKKDG